MRWARVLPPLLGNIIFLIKKNPKSLLKLNKRDRLNYNKGVHNSDVIENHHSQTGGRRTHDNEPCIVQRRLMTTYKNNSGVGSVIVALIVDQNKYDFRVMERR